jgi:hypothetical protein
VSKKPAPARPTVKPRLTSVLVEREYRLVTRDRKRRPVRLKFGKPRPLAGGSQSYCVYQIEGLEDGTRTGRVGGADGVQALYLAMQIALIELVRTPAYEQGRLTWLGSRDLGLPSDAAPTGARRPRPPGPRR